MIFRITGVRITSVQLYLKCNSWTFLQISWHFLTFAWFNEYFEWIDVHQMNFLPLRAKVYFIIAFVVEEKAKSL